MTTERRITSWDVARVAGLSRTTVSYVLNNDFRRIPPQTRQRVLDAAEQLGYKPFGPARLLRGGRSKIVLMLTPGLEAAADPGAAAIITSLGAELAEAGLHLVWQLGVGELAGASADLAPCVVLATPTEHEAAFAELARQFSVPVLTAFPGLDASLAAAATAQVDHLAELGHKRLAYAVPDGPEFKPSASIRWAAVRKAANKHSLEPVVKVTFSPDRDQAHEELSRILELDAAPTAICAYNDQVAFSVLAAANDLGIDVPGKLAVIGVDDHPLGHLAVPALSTVKLDVGDFVHEMAENVIAVAAGERPRAVRLPKSAQVIARASTIP